MRFLILAAVLTAMGGTPVQAADHEVLMLNQGRSGLMVFEPAFLKIAPGDTVHFVAKDKGHDAQSIPGMIPDGAAPFKSAFGQDLTVRFSQPGVYGYKCMPHYFMGMVGVIVVGKPTNLAAASAVPQQGKAKQVFDRLFGQAAGAK